MACVNMESEINSQKVQQNIHMYIYNINERSAASCECIYNIFVAMLHNKDKVGKTPPDSLPKDLVGIPDLDGATKPVVVGSQD